MQRMLETKVKTNRCTAPARGALLIMGFDTGLIMGFDTGLRSQESRPCPNAASGRERFCP